MTINDYRRQAERYKMLYESALEVTRRLQKERDALIDRVVGALRGIECTKPNFNEAINRCPVCGHEID